LICIKAEIPEELPLIDVKTRAKRNEFMERTQGMMKTEREEVYKEYS